MASAKKIIDVLDGLKGCFVAGGAITSIYTNKPINDFDIYPKSEEALRNAIAWLFDGSGYWCVDHSTRAMTFAKGDKGEHPNIQVMHFDTFETAEKIFEAFDFTVCMGAYDLDEERFVLHGNFLEHCSQRFLSFNRATRFPYASARRVKKYEDRGYTIGTIEFQKIMLACAAKPITSWDDLREQIGGVYGEAITIPDGEDFSEAAMWRALETLTFKGPNGGFENAEEAIVAISNAPIRCFRSADEIYAEILGEFHIVKSEPKNPIWVTASDAIGTIFYKKAIIKDGRYFGPHYSNFEYKIGEEAISQSGPGLFVYTTLERARQHGTYQSQKQIILELHATCADDIIFGPEIKLKKARVVATHDVVEKVAA